MIVLESNGTEGIFLFGDSKTKAKSKILIQINTLEWEPGNGINLLYLSNEADSDSLSDALLWAIDFHKNTRSFRLYHCGVVGQSALKENVKSGMDSTNNTFDTNYQEDYIDFNVV